MYGVQLQLEHVVDREPALRDKGSQFVRHARVKHGRIVGIYGNRQSTLVVLAHRVLCERGDDPRSEIRDRTRFDSNVRLGEEVDDARVFNRPSRVADSLDPQYFNGLSNTLWPGALAGVCRGMEPEATCLFEDAGKQFGRIPGLVSTDAYTHDPQLSGFFDSLEDRGSAVRTVVPHKIGNQVDAHPADRIEPQTESLCEACRVESVIGEVARGEKGLGVDYAVCRKGAGHACCYACEVVVRAEIPVFPGPGLEKVWKVDVAKPFGQIRRRGDCAIVAPDELEQRGQRYRALEVYVQLQLGNANKPLVQCHSRRNDTPRRGSRPRGASS